MTNLEQIEQAELRQRLQLLVDQEFHPHDEQWLPCALQTAITLEFSTVPAYLCALWSIIDDKHIAARYLLNVVQEEMLHFSLACNLLTAIGGTPKISDASFVPAYPSHLPGHVATGVRVWLGGLTPELLEQFIGIEHPANSPDVHGDAQEDESFPSIGRFYDAILECIERIKPDFKTERQMTGPLAPMVIHDLKSARAAILLVKYQGEGAAHNPEVPHTDNLAHYYRFLSIQHNQKVTGVKGSPPEPIFGGEPWTAPDVWPVAEVPKGGYRREKVPSSDAWDLIVKFDESYTRLLNSLQRSWDDGDQGSMVHSFETMFQLTSIARKLMQIELPNGDRYAPNFHCMNR